MPQKIADLSPDDRDALLETALTQIEQVFISAFQTLKAQLEHLNLLKELMGFKVSQEQTLKMIMAATRVYCR